MNFSKDAKGLVQQRCLCLTWPSWYHLVQKHQVLFTLLGHFRFHNHVFTGDRSSRIVNDWTRVLYPIRFTLQMRYRLCTICGGVAYFAKLYTRRSGTEPFHMSKGSTLKTREGRRVAEDAHSWYSRSFKVILSEIFSLVSSPRSGRTINTWRLKLITCFTHSFRHPRGIIDIHDTIDP